MSHDVLESRVPFSSIAGAKGFERRRTTSRRHVCYIELKFAVYETSTRARVAKVALKVALYPARPHRPPLIGIYASDANAPRFSLKLHPPLFYRERFDPSKVREVGDTDDESDGASSDDEREDVTLGLQRGAPTWLPFLAWGSRTRVWMRPYEQANTALC